MRRDVLRRAVLPFLLIAVFFLLHTRGWGKEFHERTDRKTCLVCHRDVPREGSSPLRENNFQEGGDLEKICGKCHSSYRHTHPVKLVLTPLTKEKGDLQVWRNGEITCVTCHDVMAKIPVHRKKETVGKKLCLSCHVESDIFAQIIWYPTHLKRGETGRLEVKVVEFSASRNKEYLGETLLLYYYAKDADTGEITFGTNVLYDDGTHGDRKGGDSIYTLTEDASVGGKKRLVYTGWVLDRKGRRSNTVNLAIHYTD